MKRQEPTTETSQADEADSSVPANGPQRSERRAVAWLITGALLMVGAYAVYVSTNEYANALLRELTDGPITEPASVFSKYHRQGEREFMWATGPKVFGDTGSRWFDMTGSPLKLERVNHGIGRDTIAAIDNPQFVTPGDPRLRKRWGQLHGGDLDRLEVIGYAAGGEARAYPVRLLNRHELVNDTIGGKPVTVGW